MAAVVSARVATWVVVGEDDLFAEGAEEAVRVGVDDDPVGGGVLPPAGLAGGDRRDAPVRGRGRAEQARHRLQRLRDQDDDPPGPVPLPGVRHGRHRPVGQVREAAQRLAGLSHAQHEAVGAPDDPDVALVPRLLAGLLGGPVGVDGPPAVRAVPAQPQGAPGGDGSLVVAVDPVAQLDVGGGGVTGAVHVGDAVRPGGERHRVEVVEGGRGAGAGVGGAVVAEDCGGPPVQHPLDLGADRVRGGGPAAAGHEGHEQQAQRHHRGTRHPPSTSHLPDRTGVGPRESGTGEPEGPPPPGAPGRRPRRDAHPAPVAAPSSRPRPRRQAPARIRRGSPTRPASCPPGRSGRGRRGRARG